MKLCGCISFFAAHREEEGRLLHHSASWKSWRIHNRLTFQRRRNPSVTTAATSRWRRRRKLKLLRVVVAAADGSADASNINTHGQMEAESHASVLASTDPSVHALKPKRMHEYQPLRSRVIPGLPKRGKRESTMPAPTSRSPHAPGMITISSFLLLFFLNSPQVAREFTRVIPAVPILWRPPPLFPPLLAPFLDHSSILTLPETHTHTRRHTRPRSQTVT